MAMDSESGAAPMEERAGEVEAAPAADARRKRRSRLWGCGLVALGVVMAVLVFGMLLTSPRVPEWGRACMSNLKHIGLALAIYENEYGELPPELSILLADGGYLASDSAILLCLKDRLPYAYIYTVELGDDENGKEGGEDGADDEAPEFGEIVAFCLESGERGSVLYRAGNVKRLSRQVVIEQVQAQLDAADRAGKTAIVRTPPEWASHFGEHAVPYESKGGKR